MLYLFFPPSLSLSLSLFVSLETYVTGSVIYNDFTLDLHRESIGTSGKRIYVLSEPIVTHVNLRSLQIERNCANLPLRIIRIKLIKLIAVPCFTKRFYHGDINLFSLLFIY